MNVFRQAHQKFVKIITYPSIIDIKKEDKRARKHWNITCMVKGHRFLVDVNKSMHECTRCGAVKEE